MIVLLLASCAYDAFVENTRVFNTVTGTVIASDVESAAPTAVLLYAADDPPPPEGTGAPVSFSMVRPRAFDGGSGLMEAPFIVSEIPDGEWLFGGLMDADGDFHPLYTSNAGATCGDYVGRYVQSLNDLSSATVSVSGGERVEGISVLIGQQVPTERPAFILDTATIDQTAALPVFSVSATGVQSEILTLADPGAPCGVIFGVRFLDDNQDNAPDPHPVYGATNPQAFAAWPRVYLQYLEAPEGESYVSEAILSPALYDPAVGAAVMPMTQMDIVFVPAAIHTRADGTEEVVQAPDLPSGAWGVTLIAETGQTWTLPNELAAFPAAEGSDFDPSQQGAALNVQ